MNENELNLIKELVVAKLVACRLLIKKSGGTGFIKQRVKELQSLNKSVGEQLATIAEANES